MNKYAIIVAGGSGTRMNSELPKQFLLLNGKPILMHTLERFSFDGIGIILVLNVDYHEYWLKLCKEHGFTIEHTLVKGGNTRYQSVKNGIAIINENALVAIHDAVRPCIKKSSINNAFIEAETFGNAVLAVSLKESIRKRNDNYSIALNRDDYVSIQTPQIFQLETLKKAYQEPYRNEFTDDASVVEYMGQQIHLVEGDHSNIKITYAEDLYLAEYLLSKENY